MRKLRVILLVPGVLVFFWLLHKLGLRSIESNLSNLKWGFLAILLASLVWHILKTFAWMLALEPGSHDIGFRSFFRARLIGEAFNYLAILSSVGGDPVKAYVLNGRLRLSRGMASVILDRVLYTATCLIFIILGIVAFLAHFPVGTQLYTVMMITLGCVVVLWGAFCAMFYFRLPVISKTLKVLSSLPYLKKRFREKRASFDKIDELIFDLFNYHRWRFLAIMGMHLLSFALSVLEIHIILFCVGNPVSVQVSFLLASLTLVFNSLSVFVPANLGSFEGAHYLMFHMLNLSPDLGLTLAIAKRIRALFWVGIGLAFFSFPQPEGRLAFAASDKNDN
jgi:uncharacterized protein (TIRG00374 family)